MVRNTERPGKIESEGELQNNCWVEPAIHADSAAYFKYH